MADSSLFLQRVRGAIRVRHYNRRTEDPCRGWTHLYILLHAKRRPAEMGAAEVAAYLS